MIYFWSNREAQTILKSLLSWLYPPAILPTPYIETMVCERVNGLRFYIIIIGFAIAML